MMKFEEGTKPRPKVLGDWPQHILKGFKEWGYDVGEAGVRRHAETPEDRAVREKAEAGMRSIKIRMLRTAKGSPDGIRVNEYKQGEVYELPRCLVDIFLSENWAEEIK